MEVLSLHRRRLVQASEITSIVAVGADGDERVEKLYLCRAVLPVLRCEPEVVHIGVGVGEASKLAVTGCCRLSGCHGGGGSGRGRSGES